ncbi:hypothetical protein IFM89_039060 [Coptis chinensis]|uniref:SRR1-like domain-containing protein n=1 Tax=Coptis chinensis TaxID=261450 RepID=A0A835I9S5_9MAGN|nr:hypothetical protein IFM89_039060 [Coptis chinensis]
METLEVLTYFLRILGSETKMQMVIYGIGSIESYDCPRLQLSFAILIKRKFDWIGDIEVNEQGRRQAVKPTMFFMPHCEAVLYDNLLRANWRPENLNKMVLFGNNFEKYEQYVYKEDLVLLSCVEDKNDPSTLVKQIDIKGVKRIVEDGKVAGGMIPKSIAYGCEQLDMQLKSEKRSAGMHDLNLHCIKVAQTLVDKAST